MSKKTAEMVIVVFFLLGVATQPPIFKASALKDPKMGMKSFPFLHRIGLIDLFQQNVKVNISASVLITVYV